MITRPAQIVPPATTSFPIVKGTIRSARGHFGAFELTSTITRPPAPPRVTPSFSSLRATARLRAAISCLIFPAVRPLFPAHDLRDGYLRADPRDPAAMLRAVLKARDLVGSFDKPKYINFTADLCAHSRSNLTGCHRCLDLCPTGAITPDGDHVRISAEICAGCGQCAAACPTGAASYALPPADTLLHKLRAMLLAYDQAGGAKPVVLLHDGQHGTPLIDALARHGDGLPANVLPLAVNEVTQVGLEAIVAAFAYGAAGVRFLLRAKPLHDIGGAFADHRHGGRHSFRTGICGTPRFHDRNRRSGYVRRDPARDRARHHRSASRNFQNRRQAARSASLRADRAASRRAGADRRDRVARRRADRRDQRQCRRMHAVPILRIGMPDRRAAR